MTWGGAKLEIRGKAECKVKNKTFQGVVAIFSPIQRVDVLE